MLVPGSGLILPPRGRMTFPSVPAVAGPSDPFAGLPQYAHLVIDWDPSSLAGSYSNGSPITGDWADTKSGVIANQPTSANRPTFVSNAQGGLPGVKGAGAQWLPIASPGIYKTTVDSRVYTTICLITNTTAASLGCPFGAANAGAGFFALANGSRTGRLNTGTSANAAYPANAAAFTMLGWTSTTNPHGGNGTGVTRDYFGGLAKSYAGSPLAASTSTFALLAQNAGGGSSAKTTMLRYLVFDVELTPFEYAQWAVALYALFGVTHPATLTDHFYLFQGDSLTAGVGTNKVELTMGYETAALLGINDYSWANLGIGGLTNTGMLANAPSDIDGIAALFGKTAIIIEQEYYNDKGRTNAAIAADKLTNSTQRKAANPGAKIIGMTPADWSDLQTPDNSSWATYFRANWAAMGYDGYADVQGDITIGGTATYPNTGPYSDPWYDGIHYADYRFWSALIAPAVAAVR